MLRRQVRTGLLNALGDTPVVCLAGASRTGKTTLLQSLQADLPEAALRAFTDPATRAEAERDPAAFLQGLPALAFLDDVDRVPSLLPQFKAAISGGRRFLLTTPRPLPALADSLSWNLESFSLWPLAQAEREGVHPALIDACFQGDPTRLALEPLTRMDLLGRLLAGGYPEITGLTPLQRERWFHGYLASLLQGRFRNLTDLREVRQLMALLAVPGGSAGRVRELLEEHHVMVSLAAGAGDRSRWLNDSALQAHILGLAPAALETLPALAEPLLETFAFMELVKTAPWSTSRPALSCLCTGTRNVILLEDHHRQVVAFTVSAAATLSPEAFRELHALQAQIGDRWRAGIILHAGGEPIGAGPGLWSLPLQALWAPRT